MEVIKYKDLLMEARSSEDGHTLEIYISMGHAEFLASVNLDERDFDVLKQNKERASYLHAAMHARFQATKLSKRDVIMHALLRRRFKFIRNTFDQEEQRYYLDVILHGSKSEVEVLLTKDDQGADNGAISNMLRTTLGKNYSKMRQGNWFHSSS